MDHWQLSIGLLLVPCDLHHYHYHYHFGFWHTGRSMASTFLGEVLLMLEQNISRYRILEKLGGKMRRGDVPILKEAKAEYEKVK
jgi:hypothetical protein